MSHAVSALTLVLLAVVAFVTPPAARAADAAAPAPSAPAAPSQAGLVLWLDASNPASASSDAAGRVAVWRDLSGTHHDATAEGPAADHPELVPHAMNGRPVLRFAGQQALTLATPLRATPGPGMVLVVWQRTADEAAPDTPQNKWQRLLSARSNPKLHDNQAPNFCLTADAQGSAAATPATIDGAELSATPLPALTLGRTAEGHWQYLHGDIAEVLVYDRAFLSTGELDETLNYLQHKWHARVDFHSPGWTRTGPLGPTPEHSHADLPLSDQANAGHWVLDKAISDEFNEPTLDTRRWHVNPGDPHDWLGRAPSLFVHENAFVKDGQLHIVFSKPDPAELQKYKGYPGETYTYAAALVQSNQLTGYGYYEIRARPMASAASSSFWFTDTRQPENQTEIDVFEIGGKAPGFESKYNMTCHVWRTPEEQRHWSVGSVYHAPFRFIDAYHTYGFEWSKDQLTWYIDGVMVRHMTNTNWTFPMRLQFDTEAMWSWFGKADDADLPSTFTIDYLRVWRHAP